MCGYHQLIKMHESSDRYLCVLDACDYKSCGRLSVVFLHCLHSTIHPIIGHRGMFPSKVRILKNISKKCTHCTMYSVKYTKHNMNCVYTSNLKFVQNVSCNMHILHMGWHQCSVWYVDSHVKAQYELCGRGGSVSSCKALTGADIPRFNSHSPISYLHNVEIANSY